MATSTDRQSKDSLSSTTQKDSETDECQIIECKAVEELRPRSHRYSPYGCSLQRRSRDHRLVLLHGRDTFFATAPAHAFKENGEIIGSDIRIDHQALPFENIWPKPMSSGTLAPIPLPSWIEVKRPKLLDFYRGYQVNRDGDLPSRELHRKFEISEDLMKHHHGNVVTYHGCIKHGDLVTGLCYTKYEQSLESRILTYREKPFDIERCLEGIYNGICHLHRFGYLHNSIHCSSVMMDSDDNPIITNFQACTREGQELDIRYCPPALQGKGYDRFKATKSNDFGNLRKIREVLYEAVILSRQ